MGRMIWLRGCGFCRNQRYTEDIPGGQWLPVCLPMQGPQFRSLVQEDSTCHGQLSLWATTTEPEPCGPCPTTRETTRMGRQCIATSRSSNPYSPQLEKTHVKQPRPSTFLILKIKFLKRRTEWAWSVWWARILELMRMKKINNSSNI